MIMYEFARCTWRCADDGTYTRETRWAYTLSDGTRGTVVERRVSPPPVDYFTGFHPPPGGDVVSDSR